VADDAEDLIVAEPRQWWACRRVGNMGDGWRGLHSLDRDERWEEFADIVRELRVSGGIFAQSWPFTAAKAFEKRLGELVERIASGTVP
jgi:hypothetical protein